MQHTDDRNDGQQHRRQRNDAVYELSELNGAGLTFKKERPPTRPGQFDGGTAPRKMQYLATDRDEAGFTADRGAGGPALAV